MHRKYFFSVWHLFTLLSFPIQKLYTKSNMSIIFLNDIGFHVILRLFPAQELEDGLCALPLAFPVASLCTDVDVYPPGTSLSA